VKDSAAFTFDFALDAESRVELDGKALRIEGYAAGFDRDREGDAFMPRVFDKGLEKYFKRNPVLCYHHHTDQALGVVEDAKLDGKGLFVKARLDDPEPGTPLADVWNKVKSGTIKGFSVGGIFKRTMTPQGPRIHTADIAEISVTPVPMEPGSLFALAGKAFGVDSDLDAAIAALNEFSVALDNLEDLAGKAMSAEQRRNAKYHFDGTEKFPIDNRSDLENAIGLIGNTSEDKAKVKAYLIRVAKKLGCIDCLPEDWLS
jgi:HK97 family phage prohead protease